ncbi:MAG: phage major capsid protein [Ruminococcus sp.]|nr:phage major capsid protein [Ruminococcus sp.]
MKKHHTYKELEARLNDILAEIKGENANSSDSKKAGIYRGAFWNHMKMGIPHNALSEGSDGSGGYLVPDEYDKRLIKKLSEKNVLRQLGQSIPTTHNLKISTSFDDASGHWVDEGAPYSFDDLEFGQVIIDAYKLGTMMLVSDEMLDDAGIDLEKYIEERFAESIGSSEEEAFAKGDGLCKPFGLIYQASVGAETSSLSIDDTIDLIYSVRAPYRKNGVFLMSDEAVSHLRKIKCHNGKPAWTGSLAEGEPLKLLGYPVFVSKAMDGISSGSIHVLFGDFSYYWIGDRGKRVIKRLSERFADRGQVGYLTFERVDAKLVMPGAIKSLKIK